VAGFLIPAPSSLSQPFLHPGGAAFFVPKPKENTVVFVPINAAAQRYGKCVKTLQRWSSDPEMRSKGFPSIIRMKNRQYLPADGLEAFDAAMRGSV
jgi:hypothetical protein